MDLVHVWNLTDSPKSRELCGYKSARPLDVAGQSIPPGTFRTVRKKSLDAYKEMLDKCALAVEPLPSWYRAQSPVEASPFQKPVIAGHKKPIPVTQPATEETIPLSADEARRSRKRPNPAE